MLGNIYIYFKLIDKYILQVAISRCLGNKFFLAGRDSFNEDGLLALTKHVRNYTSLYENIKGLFYVRMVPGHFLT